MTEEELLERFESLEKDIKIINENQLGLQDVINHYIIKRVDKLLFSVKIFFLLTLVVSGIRLLISFMNLL